MTKFIAIDGNGGAGKTYIANMLADELHATAFHLDEYGDDFHPFIGIPALVRDLRATTDAVVIFEGVGVFGAQFDEFNAVRVFVNTAKPTRDQRVAGRDVPRANRTKEDWQQIFSIWDKAEKQYYTPELIHSADLTIDNNGSLDIAAIQRQLQPFM